MAQNIDDMFTGYPDVWQFIKTYYSKHRSIPDIELVEENFNYFDSVDVHGETAHYVEALRSDFINGQLAGITKKLGAKVGKVAHDVILQGVLNDLMQLQNYSTVSHDIDAMDFESAEQDFEAVRLKALEMGGTPGIPTGIDFVDSGYVSGLSGGDLIVLLGWTGRGKSLMSTMICCNAFEAGFKPMIISLEMKTSKVRDRAYTMLGNGMFKNSDLSVGDINEDDFREFKKKFGSASGTNRFPIISHDGNNEVTPAFVQSKIDQYKPSIVVIDYAQLTSDNAGTQDMTARMRNMSKEYKRLAVANDIPIILISSATPDSAASMNTPPIIEQVAWSKQLAYDADLAFAVHKHELMLGDGWCVIEIACRKNRNGELFAGYFKANINTGVYEEFSKLDDIIEM
jgi:replicative DNA helicase